MVLQGILVSQHSSQVTGDSPLVGGRRLGRDGALPVRLVHKDGTEVADDVDDAEDETVHRLHGEEGAACVALHGAVPVKANWQGEAVFNG